MHKSDPNRVTNKNQLNEAQEMAAYLVAQRGTRGAADLLRWTMADMSRISNGKWNEIRLYPEHLAALRLAHDVVENDTYLLDQIRAALNEVTEMAGEFARNLAHVRRMVRKVTR